jgi:hypothetical protein
MFCPACGKSVDTSDRFCRQCGAGFASGAASPPQTSVQNVYRGKKLQRAGLCFFLSGLLSFAWGAIELLSVVAARRAGGARSLAQQASAGNFLLIGIIIGAIGLAVILAGSVFLRKHEE